MTTESIIKNNILIVDDHPFIIQGYKNAITRYNPTAFEFSIEQAKDCKSAYDIITNPETVAFDIAFLDISMPPYEEKGMFSGEDLAKLLGEYMPNCKIILLTMYTELLKIKNIINSINPNGLVIKNDLTFDELIFGFDKVIKNEIYYSESIQKMIDLAESEMIEIDVFDKQILFHLSKGTTVEEIPQYIPISVEAIEKRKQNLKKLLNLKEGSDIDLVREAKNKGLLFLYLLKRHFIEMSFFIRIIYSSLKAFQPLAFKGIRVLARVTKCIPSLSWVICPIIVKFGFPLILSKSSIAMVKSNS
jgi:DNA-binding NarL/FixJ family response regulator